MRRYYNGYNWLEKDKVYNPYSVLLSLKKRKFRSWWYETCTPEYLFHILKEQKITPLEIPNRLVDETLMSSFEVNDIHADSLLFQSGYLTITEEICLNNIYFYRLDYPNLEVKNSLNHGLMKRILSGDRFTFIKNGFQLVELLKNLKFDEFKSEFARLLSAIPYELHDHSKMYRSEGWYASMLHMGFIAGNVTPILEPSSARGRSDMVVKLADQIFVIEMKVIHKRESSQKKIQEAMCQMIEKGYTERYQGNKQDVYMIGLVFDTEKRALTEMNVDKL